MRSVEARIHVAATSEAAIQAFLELEAMRKWWFVERGLVEPREGGVWALAWERSEHRFTYVITGRIASLQPGHRLAIREMLYFNPDRPVFGPMTLTVEASPAAKGCELSIRQDGYQDGPDWDWYYKVVSWAWPEVAKDINSFSRPKATDWPLTLFLSIFPVFVPTLHLKIFVDPPQSGEAAC